MASESILFHGLHTMRTAIEIVRFIDYEISRQQTDHDKYLQANATKAHNTK